MTLEKDPRAFLDLCDQIVIFGANGWIGRSAVEFMSTVASDMIKKRVLLIGSKPSKLEINNQTFEIFDPGNGFEKIRTNAVFFNAAFLRREFLQKMSAGEYVYKNEKIADLAKKTIQEKQLFSFINLSSGVARNLDGWPEPETYDEYTRLKKRFEGEYAKICRLNYVPLVNCRVFSLSGKHINEFENLALSAFIRQAKIYNRIQIKSPTTKRSYIDATNLAGTLLSLTSQVKDFNLDSGGFVVTMLELAEKIELVLNQGKLEIIAGTEKTPDYFGDYEKFNNLASEFGQKLYGITDQIQTTLKAFN